MIFDFWFVFFVVGYEPVELNYVIPWWLVVLESSESFQSGDRRKRKKIHNILNGLDGGEIFATNSGWGTKIAFWSQFLVDFHLVWVLMFLLLLEWKCLRHRRVDISVVREIVGVKLGIMRRILSLSQKIGCKSWIENCM